MKKIKYNKFHLYGLAYISNRDPLHIIIVTITIKKVFSISHFVYIIQYSTLIPREA